MHSRLRLAALALGCLALACSGADLHDPPKRWDASLPGSDPGASDAAGLPSTPHDAASQLDASTTLRSDANAAAQPDASSTHDASSRAGVDAASDGATVDAATGNLQHKVTISFTTVDQHGTWSPANFGAVWIEDSRAKYVKTLNLWAFIRKAYLGAWNATSGGDTIDAVTSATLKTFGPHVSTWDFTDVNHELVPAGKYTVKIEITEGPEIGPVFAFEIQHAHGAADASLPDQPQLTNLNVHYE